MRLLVLALLLTSTALSADLKIGQLAVEQYEDGSPLLEPDTFNPGERVYVSFGVMGFTRKANAVHLDFYAQATDPAGVLLTPAVVGDLETSLTDEDKQWSPKLRGSFVLPEVLFKGRYRLAVQVHDELSGLITSENLFFRVAGPPAEQQPGLLIRDLNFYAGDDSSKPLERPAYRIGEQLQVRYRIAGFEHTSDNRIDIAYTVSLLDAGGKVLYKVSDTAKDDSPAFYPKPYVAGVFGLDLKAGSPSGHFTLKIAVRDAVGGKTAEAAAPFVVE